MDLHEQRMQCLRMAFDLSGKPDEVLAAAEKLFAFVSGKEATSDAPSVSTEMATGPDSAGSETAARAADPIAIAACGTALEMPESGNLAEAVVSVVADAPPAEVVTTEATSPATVEVSDAPVADAEEASAATGDEPAAEPCEGTGANEAVVESAAEVAEAAEVHADVAEAPSEEVVAEAGTQAEVEAEAIEAVESSPAPEEACASADTVELSETQEAAPSAEEAIEADAAETTAVLPQLQADVAALESTSTPSVATIAE